MATISSAEWEYSTRPKTSDQTMATMDDTISIMKEYALVKDNAPDQFIDIEDLMEKVKARRKEGSSQYLTFGNVKPSKYNAIKEHRDGYGPKVLFTYFSPIETLVVKIPSGEHEKVNWNFGALLRDIVSEMGLQRHEFLGTGSQTYRARHNQPSQSFSEKEADSTYRNKELRKKNDDWPHLVIEAGYSESLQRLKTDARWWIENSNGQVRIVLVFKVDPKKRTIRILKYISILEAQVPSRYPLRNRPTAVPSLTGDILVDHSVTPARIVGAPLTLEFDRIFGRNANPPQEGNIVLTSEILDDWAINCVW